MLGAFNGASYEAAGWWYHRAKGLLTRPSKRGCGAVAIDVTKTKIEGKWHYLWVAIAIDSWEVLAIQISRPVAAFSIH